LPWEVKLSPSERICPDCKSTKNFSHGVMWLCTNCGRNWSKHYRIKTFIYTNPPCFHCGSPKVISWGEYYLCKECHRKHKKEAIQATSLLNFIDKKSIVVR
jgi:uncharacterized Zn ribbon protein